MNQRTLIISIFLLCCTNFLPAQNDYLSRIDLFLVGPENVDVFHEIQSEYYIERYQQFREEVTFEKMSNLEEIRLLSNKFLKGKRSFMEIEALKKENLQLDWEILKLNDYLNLWSAWEIPTNNQELLNTYQTERCYQIEGPDFTYFPSDFRLDSLGQGSHIWWNEKVDQRMLDFKYELVEVEPARSDWVKKRSDKNCLSADPEDCLVWCLVDLPATFDTVVLQKAMIGCVDGFLLDAYDEQCERAIISEEKVEEELQVKIMDVLTGREIRVKQFEVVECN